eukprot:9405744-Pyramimonas_sp.AAC.1
MRAFRYSVDVARDTVWRSTSSRKHFARADRRRLAGTIRAGTIVEAICKDLEPNVRTGAPPW